MAAVGANTGVEFQVFEINDLTTLRAFAPQPIAFIGFLLDVGDVLLNALTLDAEARLIRADPTRAWRVELFRQMLEQRRLEIRSAPLGGWSPDFTVFADRDGPQALLTGFHWFERPYPHRGPALASVHFGDAARSGARRHLEVWEKAHDVGPAVWSILSKAERVGRMRSPTTG